MAQGPSSDTGNRVVDIRSSRRFQQAHAESPAPAGDLERFERTRAEPDDYRHRMMTNVIAFGFIALLILAAVWLADSILTMRKNQDCVISGKRNCSPIETPVSTR
jgi:hypothetical protein